MNRWTRALASVALALAFVGTASGPARADDAQEILAGCEHTGPSWGDAGYTAVFGGIEIGVSVSIGWQYTGNSASNCEDINIAPWTESGIFWVSGIEKARVYMCNSAGSCWHNAWRNCQGGCQAATDMGNVVKYQVHYASLGDKGWRFHEYD